MYCVKCGAQINDGDLFCGKCGAKAVSPAFDETELLNDASTTEESNGDAKSEKDDDKTENLSDDKKTVLLNEQKENYNWDVSDDITVTPKPYEPTVTIPPIETVSTEKKGKNIVLLTVVLSAVILIVVGSLSYFLFSRVLQGNHQERNKKSKSTVESEHEEGQVQNGAETDETASAKQSEQSEESVENKQYTGPREPVDIQIRQIDNSNFPEVTVYVNILGETKEYVENVQDSDLIVKEITSDGSMSELPISEIYKMVDQESLSINLIIDQSASMFGFKMEDAKTAANSFVNRISSEKNDRIEVISFDDYVYMQQEFTNQSSLLRSAINGIEPYGDTALMDALYVGLYQTYGQDGAKCVIGFTDGEENASSFTYNDVVTLSRNTGIPVFLIGIGDEYDYSILQDLARECSGRYYSADENNLESILEDIYMSIYQEQQNSYVIKYRSANPNFRTEFRDLVVETSDSSQFSGTCKKQYIPEADITGAFSDTYAYKDFMIPGSDTRPVTYADLDGMSLAQLRIARNEIYARHGRQFRDPLLNQWFYSKNWYLNIEPKYSPGNFDAIRPTPLSRTEQENVALIQEYENNKMAYEDIYPNASTIKLSEYDLALSKPVLQTALSQLNNYMQTATLEENKRKIKEAMDADLVRY